MLIDNSKYPILNFVLNGRIHVPEIDACSFYAEAASTQNRINEVHFLKNKNVDLLSNSFYDAMIKSSKSFEPILNGSDFTKGLESSGTIIFGNIGVSYIIKNEGMASIWFINGVCAIINTENVTFRTSMHGVGGADLMSNANLRVSFILCYILFKKYAKVDTKTISHKSKLKVGARKYKNKSDIDINLMDCTWFTTIVRNECFSVRGHFRLQPKKDNTGNWTKELIYINEFQKHGYIKRAKVLSN